DEVHLHRRDRAERPGGCGGRCGASVVAGAQHGRGRRRLLGIRIGPVVEIALAAPRGQPPDVRALAVRALEVLLGQVPVLVPLVLLLGDPEVDERTVPNVCKSHDFGCYRSYRTVPSRTIVAPSSAATR